jgi:uncharacterized YigZ family protein
MVEQTYRTISQPASCETSIERSRFIGHCLEIACEVEAKSFVTQIRAEHPQATHNCYAYRIGLGENPLEYFNDHGEPSGTAGKPILGAIQRLNLTNVAVVVTRYFGGKKLGVRGLIEAYGGTATLVLEQAKIVQKVPKFSVTLVYPYREHSTILYHLKQLEAENVTTRFNEVVQNEFLIPATHHTAFLELIKELPDVKILPIPEQ